MLLPALLASGLVSLVSFSGALALAFRPEFLKKILLFLVAFAAGTLMAGAFFHLLPEALELFDHESSLPFFLLVGGFAAFFLLERFIFWHHCHQTEKCEVHSFGYMNLIGDGIHNFLDGLVIAAAFLVDVHLGIITTVAIVAHEIPQEIADFGVLIHAGMRPVKALMFNFLSAVCAVIGVIVGFSLSSRMESFEPILLAFTAGGFIYIAASDLIPELHKERDLKKSLWSFLFFLLGLALLIVLGMFSHEAH